MAGTIGAPEKSEKSADKEKITKVDKKALK
jgi:hypothetical protein